MGVVRVDAVVPRGRGDEAAPVEVGRCLFRLGVVGHQALLAGQVFACHHHRFSHRGVLHQAGLDFAQLDAVAAQLDLKIVATEKVQAAVAAVARQITGAVHAATVKGVGHEPLGGQLGAMEITACHAYTGHKDLTRYANGHRLFAGIEQVDPRVGDGTANAGHTVTQFAHLQGGAHGRLGRAIGVDEAAVWPKALQHRGRTGISGHYQRAQAIEPRILGQCGEHRRRKCHMADGVLLNHLHQRRASQQNAGRWQHQAGAPAQRGHHFRHACVEAYRGELQHAAIRLNGKGVDLRLCEIAHAAVLDHHALGLTCGARGVDHVRQVIGSQAGVGARQVLARAQSPLRSVVLQIKHLGGRRRLQCRWHAAVYKQHHGCAVLQHIVQPLSRIGRVQRNVGATRLEHRQHSHHHVGIGLQAQCHATLRANTHFSQSVGQPVGLLVEFVVAHQPLALNQGRGRWCRSHLPLEQLVHAVLVREGCLCGVPGGQHQLSLGGWQHIQATQGRGWRTFQRAHQALQCGVHEGANTLRLDAHIGTRRERKPNTQVIHRHGKWVVGALFGAQEFNTIPHFALGG